MAANAGGTSYGADETFTTPTTPPTVVTAVASAVKKQKARLNGTVNPNGSALSDCHFEYGTTLFYGTSVECDVLAGPATMPVPVFANLTGLKGKTTYHFRLVASNPGGTSYGADRTFTTSVSE